MVYSSVSKDYTNLEIKNVIESRKVIDHFYNGRNKLVAEEAEKPFIEKDFASAGMLIKFVQTERDDCF